MDLSKSPLTHSLRPSRHVSCLTAQRKEQQIRLHLAQAEQFIHQQRPEKALAFLQASDASPSNWPILWRPGWYLLVGRALLLQNQPRLARVALTQGLKALKQLIRRSNGFRRPFLSEWREWLHHFLGISFFLDDQPTQALFYHRRGLQAIADGVVRDPELKMLIHKGMADTYLTLGAYADAIAFYTQAKRFVQDVYNPCDQGLIEWGLGRAYEFQGNPSQTSHAFSQALHIFEGPEATSLVSHLQSHLGLMHLWLHHQNEAEILLHQALISAWRTGDLVSYATALGNVAELHLAQGEPEKALCCAQKGLSLLQEAHNQRGIGHLYLILARIYESQRNFAAIEEVLTSAITVLQPTQQYGLLVQAYEQYGAFLANQGRFQEAYEQLRRAPYKTAALLLV